MPIQTIDLTGRASDYPEALSTYEGQQPPYRLLLWPHRSLTPKGFVWFIGITAGLLAVPILPLIGTPALWGLLPFLLLAIAGTWFFLKRSWKDGELVEELCIWPDHMTLVRVDPNGHRQEWEANPYWVELERHDKPVPHYLTLKGGPREVELGAFLSEEERKALDLDLTKRLKQLSQ